MYSAMKSRLHLPTLLAVLGLTCALASCRKSDPRTVHIFVPGMKNQKCAELVARAVAMELTDDKPGLASAVLNMGAVRPDISSRTVTVQYESLKLALKNIEFAIAEAGFDANEVPADPEAQRNLPPECQP